MLRIANTRNVLHLGTLAALFLFVFPLAASAQYTQSQEIELRRGWNEITLQVQPEDLRFDAILADVLEHVVIVENEDGEKYVPSDDINQITEWDLDAAYRIHVEENVTLSVEGEPYVSTAQLNLTTGWNLLPFYLNSPVAAKTVMDQMGGGVIALREGVDGRMYNPGDNQTDLEVLEPGHGYYVLAERNARVRSINDLPAPGQPQDPGTPGDPSDPDDPQDPGEDAPGDDDGGESDEEDPREPAVPAEPQIPADADYVFDTMEQMLAHRGFEVGQVVAVRGYYEPGDNGGGVFDVTDDGCAPDGATCYVPEEHQAEAVPSRISGRSHNLAYDNIIPGSVRLYYNDDNYLTDLHLHGHRMHTDSAPRPMINYAAGQLSFHGHITQLPEDRGDGRWRLEYRYATAKVRMARRNVEHIHIRWLGARPSPDFDASEHIAWAINLAADRHARSNQLEDVVVDDMYYYAGLIVHRDGVRLRGEREGVRDGQGFKVLAGEASRYFRERLDPNHSLWLPKSERSYYQNELTIWLRPQIDARLVSIKDFELHGNLDGNMDVFDNADEHESSNNLYGNEVSHLLQNTQYWNAYSTGYGASQHLHILLDNVHFHDYGGNIINTAGEPYFDGSRKVRVGNSARNHVFYDVRTRDGWMEDIEVYGYAWGAPFIIYDGKFRGLKIRDLVLKTPIGREIDYPIQIRGEDGARAHAPEKQGVFIEDFQIDATGLKHGAIVFMEGKHLSLKGGTIQTNGAAELFYHRHGGASGAHVIVEDVNVFRPSGTAWLYVAPHHSRFRLLEINNLFIESSVDGSFERYIKLNPRLVSRQTYKVSNMNSDIPPRYAFMITGIADGSGGMDVYASGDIKAQRSIIHQAEMVQDHMRFYFYNCLIDITLMTDEARNISYFDNCVDVSSGRTSDEWPDDFNRWPADVTIPD